MYSFKSKIMELPGRQYVDILQSILTHFKEGPYVFGPLLKISSKRKREELTVDLITGLHSLVDLISCVLSCIRLNVFHEGQHCDEMNRLLKEVVHDLYTPILDITVKARVSIYYIIHLLL